MLSAYLHMLKQTSTKSIFFGSVMSTSLVTGLVGVDWSLLTSHKTERERERGGQTAVGWNKAVACVYSF